MSDEEKQDEGRTIFGGRGGKGKVTFGGEGSPFEAAQAGDLARRMMGATIVQHQFTSEQIESVGFVQDGYDAYGNYLCSEFRIRTTSGKTIAFQPGSDKNFVVSFRG